MVLKKNEVVLLLGTNLGNRIAFLEEAKRQILDKVGAILKKSGIYESASWGYTSSNKFLNQVLIVQLDSSPFELLSITKKVENTIGKTSNSKIEYSDRPIDIDILFYGNQIVNSIDLVIPHPEIQNRRFTLVPLCELIRKYQHPVLKLNLNALLIDCQDKVVPRLIDSDNIDSY